MERYEVSRQARLDLAKANIKKQTTRLIKVFCPDPGCGYTVRTTAKWLAVGTPTCVCGEEMVADAIDQVPETEDIREAA